MVGSEIAHLVEFSEARAYESLVGALDGEAAAACGCRTTRIGSAVAVATSTITNSLNTNRVIGLGVAEHVTRQQLDQIAAFYREAGVAIGIEVGPFSRPPELPQWLRLRKLRRALSTTVLYRPVDRVVGGPRTVTVVRARGEEAAVVAEICCSVFRMPAPAQALIVAAGDRPEWRHWLAFADGLPVAAALSFVSEGVGWLGWDATLPSARRLGAHSALIASRINDAADAGCRYVTSETATTPAGEIDPSQGNYSRSGFALAYERATYVAAAVARDRRDGATTTK